MYYNRPVGGRSSETYSRPIDMITINCRATRNEKTRIICPEELSKCGRPVVACFKMPPLLCSSGRNEKSNNRHDSTCCSSNSTVVLGTTTRMQTRRIVAASTCSVQNRIKRVTQWGCTNDEHTDIIIMQCISEYQLSGQRDALMNTHFQNMFFAISEPEQNTTKLKYHM
jgi:hypothetical protein